MEDTYQMEMEGAIRQIVDDKVRERALAIFRTYEDIRRVTSQWRYLSTLIGPGAVALLVYFGVMASPLVSLSAPALAGFLLILACAYEAAKNLLGLLAFRDWRESLIRALDRETNTSREGQAAFRFLAQKDPGYDSILRRQ